MKTRLIDVDAVKDDFANAVYNELFEDKDNYRANRIIDIFCSLPRIEAEPVRHANWIRECLEYCSCSVCETEFDKDFLYFTYRHNCKRPVYCPNCGAKTDGGEEK